MPAGPGPREAPPAQGGEVQAPEARARRADGDGHEPRRHDRASAAGRSHRQARGRRRRQRQTFRFDRTHIATIEVDAASGDDFVNIDESNGVFTDTSRRRSTVETETTRSPAAPATRRCSAATGTTRSTATAAATSPPSAPATTRSSGTLGRRQRHRRGPGRRRHDALSTAPTPTRGSRCRRTATACFFLRSPGNIAMDTNSVETVDFMLSAERTSSASANSPEPTSRPGHLAGTLGGTIADGATDRVSVDGTAGADRISVNGDTSSVTTSGLSSTVTVQHQDPTDLLDVEGIGGDDSISQQPPSQPRRSLSSSTAETETTRSPAARASRR